jgi:sugar O-acyltransferase (sialic acid O-acetyltransferase NeuD family)
MIKVLIYGSGSLARELFDFELNVKNRKIEFVGYINDEGPDLFFEEQTKLPRLTLNDFEEELSFLVCVADPVSRSIISDKIKKIGGKLLTYIHPTALVSQNSFISEGCIIYPHVVISVNAKLGKSVILNSFTGVGHDVSIGDFTTISAYVDLTGFVKVGSRCFFGSGSRVVPGKSIGDDAKISAGITVIRSLKNGSVILPTPNKILYD